MQSNYATVSLSVLSQVFHYSEVYISKMFKKNLNQSFSRILQSTRLHHAKRFLRTSNYTLEEIAHLVGYESADYLSRIFKKTYHITPSEFRKKKYCLKKGWPNYRTAPIFSLFLQFYYSAASFAFISSISALWISAGFFLKQISWITAKITGIPNRVALIAKSALAGS